MRGAQIRRARAVVLFGPAMPLRLVARASPPPTGHGRRRRQPGEGSETPWIGIRKQHVGPVRVGIGRPSKQAYLLLGLRS